ncbi:MAG: phosphoadenosine phosphosulfate reductase domain-containing protein [bacterium]
MKDIPAANRELDLEQINRELSEKSPQEIIRWSLNLGKRVFASTSFSPNSAGLLHMISDIAPEMPVVWVDSGYNVADTYRTAEKIMAQLNLNMHIYTPEMTAERRNALMGGIPHPDDDEDLHKEFARQVKLEPFDRAIDDLQGEIWITGIRREETDFRKTLDIVTVDNRGILKVAPLFRWAEQDLATYMQQHGLPSPRHYFDPTKVIDGRECGLHTIA